MKKTLFFLALIVSVLHVSQAGYLIRSLTSTWTPPDNLQNYTLAFDGSGNPIAAASTIFAGNNSIVIVHANSNVAHFFPVNTDANLPIEVRDFHRISTQDALVAYLLCGSVGTGSTAHAFVAVIDGGFLNMQFMEYTEASVFYSIWSGSINATSIGVYACGKKDSDGIVASINISTLSIINSYKTEHWEYHKIIAKGSMLSLRFVVSGRSSNCLEIGYTEFTPTSPPSFNYHWEQDIEPTSLCVVGDYMMENDQVILASSHHNIVTLTPVTLNSTFSGTKYEFANSPNETYYLQDILTFEGDTDIDVSVVGYKINSSLAVHRHAWHGHVPGLVSSLNMDNNYYYTTIGAATDLYEHHKIRSSNGVVYSGGLLHTGYRGSVLFGTPRNIVDECDVQNSADKDSLDYQPFYLPIEGGKSVEHPSHFIPSNNYQTNYIECDYFRGEAPVSE